MTTSADLGARPELNALSMNVVRANAARPRGPGSAIWEAKEGAVAVWVEAGGVKTCVIAVLFVRAQAARLRGTLGERAIMRGLVGCGAATDSRARRAAVGPRPPVMLARWTVRATRAPGSPGQQIRGVLRPGGR